jgi:hypothetical protein
MDELTCDEVERLRLALSWMGCATPQGLEACCARQTDLMRDLIRAVLGQKKGHVEAADAMEQQRKDAEHYRWLKANRDVEYGVRYEEEGLEFEVFRVTGPVNDREWEKLGTGPSLDEAIDAAMAQTHNIELGA